MKPSALLLSCLLAAGLLSCNKRTRNTDVDGCPQHPICDEAARVVSVQLLGKDGKPVTLDDFKTVRNRDGKTMNRYQPSSWTDTLHSKGIYIVLGDGTGQTEREGLAFTFIGYKSGAEAVRERFIIGHDCCHVQLIEGPQEITLSE